MTTETPAIVIAPNPNEPPSWALAYDTWITWTTDERKEGGRYNKIPTSAAGHACNAHDRKNHRSAPVVLAAYKRQHGTPESLTFDQAKNKIAGIAIDLPNEPTPYSYAADGAPLFLIAIDLDKVQGNRANFELAKVVLKKLPGQYVEQSPSGTGLRALVLCQVLVPVFNHGGLEVYSTGRFMTITLRGKGEPSEVALEVIEEIKALYKPASAPPASLPVTQAQAAHATSHSINNDVLTAPHHLPTIDELAAMLACLPTSKADGCDNAYWFKIVSAVRDGWDSSPAAKQVVNDWCMRSPDEFDEAEFEKLWNRAPRTGAANAGIGTIIHEARQRGYMAAQHRRASHVGAASHTQVAATVQHEKRIVLTCGSDLTPAPIHWLWRDWLARGKFALLAGAPGQGKTTAAMAFAATVTIGGRLPDRTRCESGNVLIWSGEDDPTDTLLPRLIAAGADRSKVFFVDGTTEGGKLRPFDPATDIRILAAAIEEIGGVSLIIVDPVATAVAGDSHKNTEVRRSLQPMVDLAASTNAVILGITHFSKGGQGSDPASRVIGSVAFTAVARVVLVAAKVKNEDGTEKRILARGKSNIGPDNGGFEYHLAQVEALPGIQASRVEWGQPVEGSALELLADAEPQTDTDQADAVTMLEAELSAATWTSVDVATKPLRDAGFSKKQIHSASKKLLVLRQKTSMAGGWEWRLSSGYSGSKEPGYEGAEGAEGASVLKRGCSAPSMESSGRVNEGAEGAVSQNVESSASSGYLAPSGNASEYDPLFAELDAFLKTKATPYGGHHVQ